MKSTKKISVNDVINLRMRGSVKPLPPPFKAKTPAANQKLVDAWKAPDKTPVIVTKDDGTEVETTTRGGAFMLGGHTAVIFVDGIAGCYSLERVRVKP